MPIKHTPETILEKFKQTHGDKYNYSKMVYINSKTPIIIGCPKHGDFTQAPNNHAMGHGCYECGKITNKEPLTFSGDFIISRFKEVHGEKYDYSKVEYVNANTDVTIVCPKHGDFKMKPSAHFREKRICPNCRKEIGNTKGKEKNASKWFDQMNELWGNKFDFSKTQYKNVRSNVTVRCIEHDQYFTTKATILSRGIGGCDKCYEQVFRQKHSEKMLPRFIKKANKIHGNYYDYSLVEYSNNQTLVKIICPKHGVFEQIPDSHVNARCGCQLCTSSSGEKRIAAYLDSIGISFVFQKYVKIDGANYYYDFFLPEKNIMIEYDGKQHYQPIKFFGGLEGFKSTQIRDDKKNKYCSDQGIQLLRIPYYDFDRIEEIIAGTL